MGVEKKKSDTSGYTAGDNFFGQILNAGIGDEKFIRDIVEIFLEECSETLANLKLAIDAEDVKNIQLFAHKLKSSFVMFDMNEAHKIAFNLENIEPENFVDAKDYLTELNSICSDSFKAL